MYLYLYSDFLAAPKYAAALAEIEGRLLDFGISGKIIQLTQFLKFPAALKEYGGKKITTLVLVGDDTLLEEAVSYAAGSSLLLGFIPLTASRYGESLALSIGPLAIETLAARRLATLDCAQVGTFSFFGTLRLEGEQLEFHCPTFSVWTQGYATIEVINCGAGGNPADGLLTVKITPQKNRVFGKPVPSSTLLVATCRIKSSATYKLRGGSLNLKLPLQIDSIPKAIKMIVGKQLKKTTN